MAFAVAGRHTGNNGQSPSQTHVTNSTTPTASSLFLVFGCGLNQGHSTAMSWAAPVGGSLSYTQVAKSADANWDGSATFKLSEVLFRADVGGSPSAFTVTMDAWPTTDTGQYDIRCLDITGHDSADPIVQSATGGSSLSSGDANPGTVVLGAVPTAGNLIVVSFSSGADGGGAFTSPTAGGGKTFTQVHNVNGSWCQGGVWYRIADGGESATITCSDLGQTVGNYGAVAVEIRLAGAGSSVDPNQAFPFIPWRRWYRVRGMFKSTYDLLTDNAPVVGVFADADLAVTATLTSDAANATNATSSLTATATLTSAATRDQSADSALAVTATLTSAATRGATAQAALAATATLTADATVARSAQASLAVTATLTAAGDTGVTAPLAVTATLTSAASRASNVQAPLAVTATLTSVATRNTNADASLAVTATLTAAATVTRNAQVSLPVTATLTGAAARASNVQASLAVTATLTADASSGAATQSNITATLTAAATRATLGQTTTPVTATLTSAATATRNAQTLLAVTATLTSAAAQGHKPTAALAVTATLTATAAVIKQVQAPLAVTATLTADAVTVPYEGGPWDGNPDPDVWLTDHQTRWDTEDAASRWVATPVGG